MIYLLIYTIMGLHRYFTYVMRLSVYLVPRLVKRGLGCEVAMSQEDIYISMLLNFEGVVCGWGFCAFPVNQ